MKDLVCHQAKAQTPRQELEILSLISEGASNQEIANRLFLAPSTVKKHINHVFSKLQVSSRTQAIARARSTGLLDDDEDADQLHTPANNLPQQLTPFIGRA